MAEDSTSSASRTNLARVLRRRTGVAETWRQAMVAEAAEDARLTGHLKARTTDLRDRMADLLKADATRTRATSRSKVVGTAGTSSPRTASRKASKRAMDRMQVSKRTARRLSSITTPVGISSRRSTSAAALPRPARTAHPRPDSSPLPTKATVGTVGRVVALRGEEETTAEGSSVDTRSQHSARFTSCTNPVAQKRKECTEPSM